MLVNDAIGGVPICITTAVKKTKLAIRAMITFRN